MRLIAISLAAVVVLLVATQIFLPRYLEHRVESRFEADGGDAKVTLEALPALRLLAHDGDRISIDGHDLVFELSPSDLRASSLKDLDGFDEVEMRLVRLRAEPFEVSTFDLSRPESSDTYTLRMSASTSAAALLAYGATRLPGLLPGAIVGSAASAFLGNGRVPIQVRAELVSDDGRPRVVTTRGTVAGLQVGPLVQLLAGAVLSRI